MGRQSGDYQFELVGSCDEVMLDLWQQAWQATFPTIDFAQRRVWFEDHVQEQCAAGAHILTARAGDVLVGCALYHPSSAYIDQLVVARAWFGRGVGQALLAELRARVDRPLRLDVNQDNHRACRFYRAAGFEVVAEGRNALSGMATFSMCDRSMV